MPEIVPSGSGEDAADPSFWAVIPAGGAGTRLWPLSRAGRPKFLLDVDGSGQSMLQNTVSRLTPLCANQCLVVTGAAHEEAVRAQLPDLGADGVLAEPVPRDSMAAIGLAAALIELRDPEAVIGSFAADHVIGSQEVFRDTVREAIEVARRDFVVTIGMTPDAPSTGFGYIRRGDSVDIDAATHGYHVHSFVEKPNAETAKAYLETGGYFWNAGMFVVKAKVLLDLLSGYLPELAAGLRQIAATFPTGADAAGIGSHPTSQWAPIWEGLQRISIDHAVAEPAAADGRVAVVIGGFPWNDVGDFEALCDLVPTDRASGLHVVGNAVDVLAQDATGLVVGASDRMIAVLGVGDIVVVDTPDALLVTDRAHAQQVKAMVEALKQAGRTELT